MGQRMEPSLNNLQQKVNANGEELVDNEETDASGVSTTPERPVRGIDWTTILARLNLESPGYKETVEKMKADGRLKNHL